MEMSVDEQELDQGSPAVLIDIAICLK